MITLFCKCIDRSNVKKTELCFPLLNEFDRIRSTGEVNLLETVKYMAEKDERLIPSFVSFCLILISYKNQSNVSLLHASFSSCSLLVVIKIVNMYITLSGI